MKSVWLIMFLFAMLIAPSATEPKIDQGSGAEDQSSPGTRKVLDLAPSKVLDLVFRVEDISKG